MVDFEPHPPKPQMYRLGVASAWCLLVTLVLIGLCVVLDHMIIRQIILIVALVIWFTSIGAGGVVLLSYSAFKKEQRELTRLEKIGLSLSALCVMPLLLWSRLEPLRRLLFDE